MNDIQVFVSAKFGKIRALRGEDGEPVFVAKDICAILDLGNPRSSIALLDDDEKGVHSVDTPGGRQQMTTVTEPGFYKLVMRSRKPEAKAFKRWVTHEVLPAIRRDGGYMVARDETPEETMARAFVIAQATIDRQKSRIAELEPKALFADAVAASDGTCLVGELAKMMRQNGLTVGQNRLFAMLREDGYLGNVGNNRNVPTQRAMDLGLFRIKETAVTHSDGHVTINRTPKVTGKGQIYFIKRYCPKQLA
jgi:anti-repressor protein